MPYIRNISQIKLLSNLLDGVLHFVLQLYFQNRQKKTRRWYLSEKKIEEKQNIATIMKSIDGKVTVFPM